MGIQTSLDRANTRATTALMQNKYNVAIYMLRARRGCTIVLYHEYLLNPAIHFASLQKPISSARAYVHKYHAKISIRSCIEVGLVEPRTPSLHPRRLIERMGYEGSIYSTNFKYFGQFMLCLDNVGHLRFASTHPLPNPSAE